MRNTLCEKIPSSKFDYDKEFDRLISEASDLHGYAFGGRIYEDACDEGFIVVSENTGNEVLFALFNTQIDANGDVEFWEFRAVDALRDKEKLTATLQAVIYND